jgi:hypothetical protein
MIRTTVYLDEEDKRRLSALAAETGLTEAELIRRGIRLIVNSGGERPRPKVGYGRSTDGRCAADTDAVLTETGFGTH